MVRKGGHTFLLSSGQMCHYPVRAAESKYGKFAYSSAFGYSVPTGSYFVQAIGGDNMLALSDDEGERWKLRRVAIDARIEEHEGAPVLVSGWKPWADVEVETWLLPPADEAPNWHLRVHRLKTGRTLKSSEGAWGLHGTQERNGRELEALGAEISEGRHDTAKEALAVSVGGAVGIVELADVSRHGKVWDADANGNIMDSRSVLPTLAMDLKAGDEFWFATAVFAIPASAEGWRGIWRKEWEKRPVIPGWLRQRMSR